MAALAGDALHRGGNDCRWANLSEDGAMSPWLLVAVMVTSTVIGDVLQSKEMKKGFGQARREYLVLAIAFMAVSFFAFVKLLSIADLSFAVPASAATVVLETILAKLLLKEQVDIQRWAGAGLVACGVALLAL